MTLHLPRSSRDYSSAAILARLRERRRPRPRPKGPGLIVGRRSDGSLLVIPDSVRGETSMVLTAPSGFGKSFLLYWLACQEIARRRGVLILDPHGSLCDMLLNFACCHGVPPERLLVIQPLLPGYTTRLNPLEAIGNRGSGTALATQTLIRTCGDTSFQTTPRLGRYLRAGCLALECSRLPLSLLPWLLGLSDSAAAFRARLIPHIQDAYCRHVWEEFQGLSKRDQLEHLESSANRVSPFLATEAIRRLVTFPSGNVDWRAVMDAGGICLVNLGNLRGEMLSDQEKQLCGILVLHGLLSAGLRRQPNVSRPFTVIIDELGCFVTPDLASALDQLRKFRISFILAHQRRDQIEQVSRDVWSSVATNCQVKAAFGGLCREDAEYMAKEIYTGEIALEETKYETRAISFRPVTTWQEIVSQSEGGGSSWSVSSGQTSGSSAGTNVLYASDGIWAHTPTGWTHTEAFQEAQSQGESWGESRSWGTTRTSVPVTAFEEFEQPPARTFYSLEEQWERRVAQLKTLPKRTVALKLPGYPVELVRTLDVVERIVPPEVLADYLDRVCRASPYVVPVSMADEEFNRQLSSHELLVDEVSEAPPTQRLPATLDRQRERQGKVALPAADPVAALHQLVRDLDPSDPAARNEVFRSLACLAVNARKPLIKHVAVRLSTSESAIRAAMKQAVRAKGKK